LLSRPSVFCSRYAVPKIPWQSRCSFSSFPRKAGIQVFSFVFDRLVPGVAFGASVVS
jgi:hypothetical protein